MPDLRLRIQSKVSAEQGLSVGRASRVLRRGGGWHEIIGGDRASSNFGDSLQNHAIRESVASAISMHSLSFNPNFPREIAVGHVVEVKIGCQLHVGILSPIW